MARLARGGRQDEGGHRPVQLDPRLPWRDPFFAAEALAILKFTSGAEQAESWIGPTGISVVGAVLLFVSALSFLAVTPVT